MIETPFRVIIAGWRFLNGEKHGPFVFEKLDQLLFKKLPNVIVLSGACTGADTLGESWANYNGLQVERYPADWEIHGRVAGPMRNAVMVGKADALICFDGGGPGSADIIRKARMAGLQMRVVDWPGTLG